VFPNCALVKSFAKYVRKVFQYLKIMWKNNVAIKTFVNAVLYRHLLLFATSVALRFLFEKMQSKGF
jgi:hypothetical protein